MGASQDLFDRIKSGDHAAVQTLLAADPSLANTQIDGGPSAVLLAVYYGQLEIAQTLASHCDNLSIFEAAALGDDERALSILNTHPELIDATASDGFTPLGLASFFGHADVVDLLLGMGATVNLASRNNQRVMPLHSAVAGGHLEVVRALLERSADVNATQEGGFTPIHGAAQNGQLAMVKLLLEYGADASAASNDGKTALDFARESGSAEVVQLLSS